MVTHPGPGAHSQEEFTQLERGLVGVTLTLSLALSRHRSLHADSSFIGALCMPSPPSRLDYHRHCALQELSPRVGPLLALPCPVEHLTRFP